MGIKNNTEFDIDWLRGKGFIGDRDTGDELDPADPEQSEVFTYRKLMDHEGRKEIKVFIAIDLVIPGASRIYFQYHNSHHSLKNRAYNGDIMSKEMLILLLKAIYPGLAKKFAK